jgi:meso-butanediol dehydrogenase/(S,S)-butanediol dehydrogenase/diacetyl reductase
VREAARAQRRPRRGRGTVNTCQAFGPLLRERRGAVDTVASHAAPVSLPQQAAYTAAKGAVAALTRSLAIDWAVHGVRANAVAPGLRSPP